MTTFSHERALPERLALNHLAINRTKEIVMNNILVLNSSVSREDSVSRILIGEALIRLLDADPQAAVIHRDLGTDPIPLLTTDNLAGISGKPSTQLRWSRENEAI